MCTNYVNSINECFPPYTFFHNVLNYFLMFQCNEHVLFRVHLDDNYMYR